MKEKNGKQNLVKNIKTCSPGDTVKRKTKTRRKHMQNMSDEHVLSIYKKLLQLSNETTQVRTDSPAKEMHRWQVDLEDALHHISPGKYELEQRETATNSPAKLQSRTQY